MGPGFCCYRFNSYLDTVSTVKLAVCFDTFNTPQNCSRFDTDICLQCNRLLQSHVNIRKKTCFKALPSLRWIHLISLSDIFSSITIVPYIWSVSVRPRIRQFHTDTPLYSFSGQSQRRAPTAISDMEGHGCEAHQVAFFVLHFPGLDVFGRILHCPTMPDGWYS